MKYFNSLIIIIIVFNSNFLNAQEQKLKNEITKNLRCLVCQGQSIADSNSEFALTLKMFSVLFCCLFISIPLFLTQSKL